MYKLNTDYQKTQIMCQDKNLFIIHVRVDMPLKGDKNNNRKLWKVNKKYNKQKHLKLWGKAWNLKRQ